MGKQGILEKLGTLVDEQLENKDSLQESTKYVYACLNNLARYSKFFKKKNPKIS